jgi:hypothetical protein
MGANFPAGAFTARYGDTKTLAAGLFLQCMAGVALALSPSVFTFAVAEVSCKESTLRLVYYLRARAPQ